MVRPKTAKLFERAGYGLLAATTAALAVLGPLQPSLKEPGLRPSITEPARLVAPALRGSIDPFTKPSR